MKAYKAMASKAGRSLAEAVQMRYELLEDKSEGRSPIVDPYENRTSLEDELKRISHPAAGNRAGERGSEEREKFFKEYVENLKSDGGGGGGIPPGLLQQLLAAQGSGSG